MVIWLKRILIVVVGLLALALLAGNMLPNDFLVSRKVTIAAPPEAIHALVGDLSRWHEWTAWQEDDPSLRVTLGAQTQGIGASQSWSGRDGNGALVVTEWDSLRGIGYNLTLDASTTDTRATIHYQRKSDGTTVTWRMTGTAQAPLLGGLYAAMMDPLVGPSMEIGLLKLKFLMTGHTPP